MSRMWKMFRQKNSGENINKHTEEYLGESKKKQLEDVWSFAENNMMIEETLQKMFTVGEYENNFSNTLHELIETVEGLISVVNELSKECSNYTIIVNENEKLKDMLSNHHTLLKNLQENHSKEMQELYTKKTEMENEFKKNIEYLSEKNSLLKIEIESLNSIKTKLNIVLEEKEIEICQLKEKMTKNESLSQENQKKIESLLEIKDKTIKTINMEHLTLQEIFYYEKIRKGIACYLNVSELIKLKNSNKFFRFVIAKEESQLIVETMTKKIHAKNQEAQKDILQYEKMYDNFPTENIKMNALKYLFFRIKPGAYILPYLREQDIKEAEKEKTWKDFFSKKERFNSLDFKEKKQFKEIENKIEECFGKLLQWKTKEDLMEFEKWMERQLSELKEELRGKKEKIEISEWAAELCCFTKFLYMETSELSNLLAVVFGWLVKEHRQNISFQSQLEEKTEKEIIIRRLVEQLSKEKAALEFRIVELQKQELSLNLANAALSQKEGYNEYSFAQYSSEIVSLKDQNQHLKKEIENERQKSKKFDEKVIKLKKELEDFEIEYERKEERKMSADNLNSDDLKIK